jgi:predicted transcriptional regulator
MTDKRFTVRLSPEDQAVLARLADLFETDRSETMRRALRLALDRQQPPASDGVFVAGGMRFNVRMKGVDDG